MNLDIQFEMPQTFKTLRIRGGKYPHEYISIGRLSVDQFQEVLSEWQVAQMRVYREKQQQHLGLSILINGDEL